MNAHLGALMHELGNLLNTATLAISAMESGRIGLGGATGAMLKRSIQTMSKLVHGSLEQVRSESTASKKHVFGLAGFIAEARAAAELDAQARGCRLSVSEVDPHLAINGNRDLLLGAVANLLNNALKFTHAHTEVHLSAYEEDNRILIEIRDQCGGLPSGDVERMFVPFTQLGDNKTGLGLGVPIARQDIATEGGILGVTNLPGTGCLITISLARYTLEP